MHCQLKSDLWVVGSQCRVPTFSVSANIQFTQFCFLLREKRNQFYNFKVRDKRPHWLRCDVQIAVFEMKNSFHLKIPFFPNFLHNKNTALLWCKKAKIRVQKIAVNYVSKYNVRVVSRRTFFEYTLRQQLSTLTFYLLLWLKVLNFHSIYRST